MTKSFCQSKTNHLGGDSNLSLPFTYTLDLLIYSNTSHLYTPFIIKLKCWWHSIPTTLSMFYHMVPSDPVHFTGICGRLFDSLVSFTNSDCLSLCLQQFNNKSDRRFDFGQCDWSTSVYPDLLLAKNSLDTSRWDNYWG